MKLTKAEKTEAGYALSIVVEKAEFEQACEKSYRKNVHNINIQGFRKGKAPRKMIEKLYGKEIFYEDAMSLSYPAAYEQALEEADIEPIDRPALTDFDVSEDGEFSFKAVVPVKPEVELAAYKGLEAVREEPKIEPAEVDAEIDRLRERNASLVTVARPAQAGDTVMLDFEGFVDDVAFEGGKGENFSLKLGSGTFIPGFEDQLIGREADQACEVNVTFPEEYQAKDLAGKAAVFKCRVNEVKESVKPELDDEFAKDVSEFDTLEAFKADLSAKMLERRAAQADSEFDDALHNKLLEGLTVELPPVMVENQLDRVSEDFNYRLSMQGVSLEMYLQMNQMNMEQFRDMFRQQAERQVKIRLALEKAAQLEGIQASEEEIDAEVARLAEQYGMEAGRIREALGAKGIGRDLAVQKVMQIIRDSAVAGKAKAKKPAKKKAETEDDKKPADKKPAKKAAAKKPAKAEQAEGEDDSAAQTEA